MNGDGPQPLSYVLSRLCEEFCCLPSVAWRELMRSPAGLLEEIIEARHYATAKAQYEAGHTDGGSELLQMAKLIDFELAAERLQEARGA